MICTMRGYSNFARVCRLRDNYENTLRKANYFSLRIFREVVVNSAIFRAVFDRFIYLFDERIYKIPSR